MFSSSGYQATKDSGRRDVPIHAVRARGVERAALSYCGTANRDMSHAQMVAGGSTPIDYQEAIVVQNISYCQSEKREYMRVSSWFHRVVIKSGLPFSAS